MPTPGIGSPSGVPPGTRIGRILPRPPLGPLVFDHGVTFTVDTDYVVGREPEVDERVRAGQARGIIVDDSTGTISRRHEIRLDSAASGRSCSSPRSGRARGKAM